MSNRILIQLIFFLQALSAGGLFPRIPDIQAGLSLDEATLGLALTVAATGGLINNLVAGRIIGAVGTKAILTWGIPALAALTALVAFAPTTPTLFAILFVMGMSFSLTNVAMNVEADRVEAATGRRVMNRCHGVWSAGMLLAALIGTGARAASVSAPAHLALMVPVALLAALVIFARMEAARRAPDDKADSPRFALPTSRTLVIVLFGLSGGIAQSGTQNWSVIYLEQTFQPSGWIATLPLSAFLIAMTGARMLADGWSERFGSTRVAAILTGLALAGSLTVVAAPSVWMALAGFAMMGAGTSVLFPLMVTAAARNATRPAAEAVSAVLFLTGVAMLVAPAIMGWIAEGFGLRVAFWSLVPPFLITLGLVRRVTAPSATVPTRSARPAE